jgi:2,3-dihydroxyphenylpropionate 1,2-dioxygenase
MSLVAALAATHTPGITAWTEQGQPDRVERFFTGYATLKAHLEAARPDLLIVITPEHWWNFFLNNMPSFCLGIGESFEGPAENWLRIPRSTVKGAPKHARALFEAMSHEIDLSFSKEIILDHGSMVPLSLFTPRMDLPVIPLFVNCLTRPLPPLRRSLRMGEVLGEIVRAWPERVGLIATGGISHWPAMPEAGKINEEFDRRFLEAITNGRGEEFTGYSDDEIETEAGPGAHEIRTWLAVAGAVQGGKGEIVAYEPIPAWATGCGLAVFHTS